MIAPTTEPMKPAPSPALYQLSACPRKEATNAPTMPRMVVMMKPDSSLSHGMMNFATTPARNPMMMVQMMLIGLLPIFDELRRGEGGRRPSCVQLLTAVSSFRDDRVSRLFCISHP